MTNPKKSAAMRERYAKLRAPIVEKLRELTKATPTLTAMELAPLLGVYHASVRQYAKEAGLQLPRSPIGRRPGYKEPKKRASVSEEVRKRRGAAISALAAKKRAKLLEQLKPLLAANPEASNIDLARTTGVSRQTVGRVLAAAGLREPGVHLRPRGRRPSAAKQRKPRASRTAPPIAPVDQPREVNRWHTAKLRVVRVADGVMLASTNAPETALRLCAFFGPGVEMRRAA